MIRENGPGVTVLPVTYHLFRSDKHEIVAVDQFGFFDVAENLFDFAAGVAGDAAGFVAGVVGQSACQFVAGFVAAANGCTAPEFTFDADHTDRQQAGAALQGVRSTGIQHQRTRELQVVGQPLFACSQRCAGGIQQGAEFFATRREPLRAARCAAWILVIMPPREMPLPAPPAMAS